MARNYENIVFIEHSVSPHISLVMHYPFVEFHVSPILERSIYVVFHLRNGGSTTAIFLMAGCYGYGYGDGYGGGGDVDFGGGDGNGGVDLVGLEPFPDVAGMGCSLFVCRCEASITDVLLQSSCSRVSSRKHKQCFH